MKKNIKLIATLSVAIIVSINIFQGSNNVNFSEKNASSVLQLEKTDKQSLFSDKTNQPEVKADVENKAISTNVDSSSKSEAITKPSSSSAAVDTETKPSAVKATTVATTTSAAAFSNPAANSNVAAPEPKANTEQSVPLLNEDNKNNGNIKVKYLNNTGKKMKVGIKKDSNNTYYDFKGNGEFESFPLQFSSGAYTISLFLNDTGTKYSSIKNWNIQVNIVNANSVYINSNQIVNFANAPMAVNKAKQLTSGINSDESKAKAIYNYIVNNMVYDSNKASSTSTEYIPNIDSTLSSSSGMCYDFASIYAGMLRSVGIPAKLVMGTSTNVSGYHAWNEIYVNGNWMIVDTSYDAQARLAKVAVTLYKSSSNYSKSKEY